MNDIRDRARMAAHQAEQRTRSQINNFNAQLGDKDAQIVALRQQLDAAQRQISGLRSQVACLERQLAESDEATKRAWREAGRSEG